MPVPLKVYYCHKCYHRMPLYYRRGESYRDDRITRCKNCGCVDALTSRNEVWIKKREEEASKAKTIQEKFEIFQNPILFTGWPYPW
jgi:DNA replicative helicase MCM subunit Mcm2 (Cdc46/Mcm family)